MWLAFFLGLAGSLHCLGMCGPLLFLIPSRASNFFQHYFTPLVYLLGKSFSYGVLGILIASFGRSLNLYQYQQYFTIGLGLILLIVLFFPNLLHLKLPISNKFQSIIKKLFAQMYSKEFGISNSFVLGALNGILPCGMVYVALAGSIASSSIINGFLYMFFFGLGTAPMLYFLLVFKQSAPTFITNFFKKYTTLLLFITASLIILRGLNLGIPYLSPKAGISGPTCSGNR